MRDFNCKGKSTQIKKLIPQENQQEYPMTVVNQLGIFKAPPKNWILQVQNLIKSVETRKEMGLKAHKYLCQLRERLSDPGWLLI